MHKGIAKPLEGQRAVVVRKSVDAQALLLARAVALRGMDRVVGNRTVKNACAS